MKAEEEKAPRGVKIFLLEIFLTAPQKVLSLFMTSLGEKLTVVTKNRENPGVPSKRTSHGGR